MLLDIRTMMVMTALLAFLLAGLLLLASLHAADMRGIRTWALAEASIGLSLGLAYTQLQPGSGWIVVAGSALLALGFSLQGVGIRQFCRREPKWHWVWLVVGLVAALNIHFAVLHPDINSRVVANSVILAAVSGVNARSLLTPVDPQVRTAYWFTGGVLATLTLMLLARATYVAAFPDHDYGLYARIAINPATFFVASMLQLALVFGFVLMMHFHIAGELQTLAARDGLTGALNRRSLVEVFDHLRALNTRTGGVLAIMMIDVDRFKLINDRHGHLVGDDVLRRLAEVVEATIRKQDYFARYGGEEFCILLPATSEADAMMMGERLRAAYAATSMGTDDDAWYSTISIGVADSALRGFDFDTLIASADHALYAAKHAGRNRVVAYSATT